MASDTPAWLTAITIMAPVVASFGVLFLSNKQQTKTINAQHSLSLQKEKIATKVAKAEQLYEDIQLRRKHTEANSIRWATSFIQSKSKADFLKSTDAASDPIGFDLVRMELNLAAYFPELEEEYRDAKKLLYAVGDFLPKMMSGFHWPNDDKRSLNSSLIQAERNANEALEKLGRKVAKNINSLLEVEDS